MLRVSSMLEYPRLLVLYTAMFLRSYHLSTRGFSDVVTGIALLVFAVSMIDEVNQVTLTYLVFDAEVSR